MKKGIIVASFGTSYEETRKLCIESVEEKINRAFEDIECVRAFTSRMIINKLKKRDNLHILTEEEAVEKLKTDGVDKIYIQPLHIITGHEYEKLLNLGAEVSSPLLTTDKDYEDVVKYVNSSDLEDNTALIFMGHGSDHNADESYEKLQNEYRKQGYDNVYVGTVEGSKTLEDIIEELKEKDYKKVVLQPFMLVAGDHAINDMASDEDDSWKTVLTNEGYEVETRVKGLGEYDKIQDMYVEHLKEIVEVE